MPFAMLSIAASPRAVVACSALKEAYRRVLLGGLADVRIVFLDAPVEELGRRLRTRRGHFMPARLLSSQITTLEKPAGAFEVDPGILFRALGDHRAGTAARDPSRPIGPETGIVPGKIASAALWKTESSIRPHLSGSD